MQQWTPWRSHASRTERRDRVDSSPSRETQDWLEWQASWWAPWQYAWQSWWQLWGTPLPGLLPASLTPERLQSYAPSPSSVGGGVDAAPAVQRECDVSEDEGVPAPVKRKSATPVRRRRPSHPPRRPDA
jgi:hypothetical protein